MHELSSFSPHHAIWKSHVTLSTPVQEAYRALTESGRHFVVVGFSLIVNAEFAFMQMETLNACATYFQNFSGKCLHSIVYINTRVGTFD